MNVNMNIHIHIHSTACQLVFGCWGCQVTPFPKQLANLCKLVYFSESNIKQVILVVIWIFSVFIFID